MLYKQATPSDAGQTCVRGMSYQLLVLRIDPKAPMVVSDLKIELEEGFKQVVKWKKGNEINGKNH